jgi:hypothetical protein
MESYATAGGGAMSTRILRKPVRKRKVSGVYNRAITTAYKKPHKINLQQSSLFERIN